MILVTLEVSDFEALAIFETTAVTIMKKHHGRLVSAFETERRPDGSGQEIHLIEFPNKKSFSEYRKDPELMNNSDIRNKAISKTTIKISIKTKSYNQLTKGA